MTVTVYNSSPASTILIRGGQLIDYSCIEESCKYIHTVKASSLKHILLKLSCIFPKSNTTKLWESQLNIYPGKFKWIL